MLHEIILMGALRDVLLGLEGLAGTGTAVEREGQ